MNVLFEELTALLLVFARMSGMILFNPLLARRNVPTQLRMVFILSLSILIAPTLDTSRILSFSDIDYVLALFMELLTGLIAGFVFQLFYNMLLFAGDFLDFEFGISMARVFDPGSNIQMSISGTFLTVIFVLYIFATDSHLELIRIFASSYRIIPLGVSSVDPNIGMFFVDLFSGLFMLAIKVVLPFLVAQVTLEAAMGILMKLIPQITVFVINIQLKLLLGLGLLFLFAVPISRFLDNYLAVLFQSMSNALSAAS
jgi:flagellar biosynthetic protein FliR